jgi:hypothetical protein
LSNLGDQAGTDIDAHSLHSMLRERIVEHVFIGEMLRMLWRKGVMDVEVLRSESDAYGYDLVLCRADVVRHVQLKTMRLGGKAREVKVGLRLAEKPSGCVVWIIVTDNLDLDHFLWFGGQPGEQMPGIHDLKVAKHTKGNALGEKLERPLHRVVQARAFERIVRIETLAERLLGEL